MTTKMEIGRLKYWIRIHHIPLHKFGEGMYKNNPIKVRNKKRYGSK